jgi:hypothetical protein
VLKKISQVRNNSKITSFVEPLLNETYTMKYDFCAFLGLVTMNHEVYMIYVKTIEYLCRIKQRHNVYQIHKVKAVKVKTGQRDKKVSDQMKTVRTNS